MDRERHDGHDPTLLHHSSIALLQERFRQLQRVKEMREERQLLRMLTLSTSTHQPNKQFFMISTRNSKPTSTSTYQPPSPTTSFFHPEFMILPSTLRSPSPTSPHDPPHVSLSLWPTSSHHHVQDHPTNAQAAQPPAVSITLRSSTHNKNVYGSDSDSDSDSHSAVDTSLHL